MKGKLVALLVAALVVPVYSSAAPADIGRPKKEEYQQIQESKMIRYLYGLNQDDDYVKGVVREYTASNKFGAALTDAEIRELENRFAYQRDHKRAVVDYLNTLDSYAWSYFDQKQGGIYVIGLKGEAYKNRQLTKTIRDLYGMPNQISIRKAACREADLIELSNRIFRDRDKLKAAGVIVKKTEVNTPKEKVDVYMSQNSMDAQNLLLSLYPRDRLAFYEAENEIALTARTDVGSPLEGGLMITRSATSTEGYCSSGFVAKRGNSYYLLTAGHCTATNDLIYQGGCLIGMTAGSHISGNPDTAAIHIPAASASKYVYGSSSKSVSLTSAEAAGAAQVGDSVCMAGASSGETCGYVKSVYVNDTIGTADYYGVSSAYYTSAAGDSGGTVYDGSILKGIHFGNVSEGSGVPMVSYYSKVADILAYWGLTF
ncbi:S1 family peptidase [Gorillibacterium timonense]|uniref:S1 family peptidase n=1 Tax=Gorillibacterium timonense TaxID=1689269 RepID=UPI00071CF4DC|nr:S1 family peptidase [Gorillibacterium timonense]